MSLTAEEELRLNELWDEREYWKYGPRSWENSYPEKDSELRELLARDA